MTEQFKLTKENQTHKKVQIDSICCAIFRYCGIHRPWK